MQVTVLVHEATIYKSTCCYILLVATCVVHNYDYTGCYLVCGSTVTQLHDNTGIYIVCGSPVTQLHDNTGINGMWFTSNATTP